MMNISKRLLATALLGVVVGVFWLVAIRVVTLRDESVHYHANFALYIDGKRQEFKSPLYYEEVQSCTDTNVQIPQSRAHMHNQESTIVHVHDNAATWGHFFANLGFGLSNKALTTDEGVVLADGQNDQQLSFILNGEVVDTIANRVIGDTDVLLINYGNETEESVHERFDAIPTDAHKYNDNLDPAGCSGTEPLTFTTRLKKAFGF